MDASLEQRIGLDDLMAKIREKLSDSAFDLVVGVARGGVLPAYLASRWLDLPLETIHLNLRDDSHRPVRDIPLLLKPVDFAYEGKRILLCDDVSNSGATLKMAADCLPGALIRSLVISGKADISLCGPHDRCIFWPWNRVET
jgi:hypoxanthine phosphoribosyltransferase